MAGQDLVLFLPLSRSVVENSGNDRSGRAVRSGKVEIFLCHNGQGRRAIRDNVGDSPSYEGGVAAAALG